MNSAATAHMLKSRKFLNDGSMAVQSEINTVGSSSVMNELEGEAEMSRTRGIESAKISRVLCILIISENLLSVACLCKEGYTVTLTEAEYVVHKVSTVVGRCAHKSGVYEVGTSSTNRDRALPFREAQGHAFELWYCRLYHVDRNKIRKMSNQSVARGLDLSPNAVSAQSEPCIEEKITEQS